MALPGIPISENECIGDSLWTINNALTSLDAAGASVTVSTAAPSSPSEGDLWFDENSGILYMWYTDGSSNQWVDVGGGDSGTSAGSVNGIVKSDGSGNFSAAVAGTDYLTSATLGSSPAAAKAWVNFNGITTATIRSSYNVSSVTKNGAGDYTVNFATALADANYSAFVTTGSSATINVKGSDGPRTTSNIQIFSRDVVTNSQSDPLFVNVSIFGN
jgi:hypothetical protein